MWSTITTLTAIILGVQQSLQCQSWHLVFQSINVMTTDVRETSECQDDLACIKCPTGTPWTSDTFCHHLTDITFDFTQDALPIGWSNYLLLVRNPSCDKYDLIKSKLQALKSLSHQPYRLQLISLRLITCSSANEWVSQIYAAYMSISVNGTLLCYKKHILCIFKVSILGG